MFGFVVREFWMLMIRMVVLEGMMEVKVGFLKRRLECG